MKIIICLALTYKVPLRLWFWYLSRMPASRSREFVTRFFSCQVRAGFYQRSNWFRHANNKYKNLLNVLFIALDLRSWRSSLAANASARWASMSALILSLSATLANLKNTQGWYATFTSQNLLWCRSEVEFTGSGISWPSLCLPSWRWWCPTLKVCLENCLTWYPPCQNDVYTWVTSFSRRASWRRFWQPLGDR